MELKKCFPKKKEEKEREKASMIILERHQGRSIDMKNRVRKGRVWQQVECTCVRGDSNNSQRGKVSVRVRVEKNN